MNNNGNIRQILAQILHHNQNCGVNEITSTQQTTSNDEQCIVCLSNDACNHKICTTCYAGYVRKYSEYDDDDDDDSEEDSELQSSKDDWTLKKKVTCPLCRQEQPLDKMQCILVNKWEY